MIYSYPELISTLNHVWYVGYDTFGLIIDNHNPLISILICSLIDTEYIISSELVVLTSITLPAANMWSGFLCNSFEYMYLNMCVWVVFWCVVQFLLFWLILNLVHTAVVHKNVKIVGIWIYIRCNLRHVKKAHTSSWCLLPHNYGFFCGHMCILFMYISFFCKLFHVSLFCFTFGTLVFTYKKHESSVTSSI